ncbi:hypothetical protein [Methanonatronarchaeum sp. AMET-Sl]|uniref:hypothetical protein n=1 Tax=Methanonatronarchaeum sp. AMET-Sl TaxID=3037654 RepID=UPI00244D9A5B|nr:hypothetical protein [Methanonatronarchaeum sp. AMET-Sl]WGI17759.1 hypothetical protein QEN48_01770 [Methanonatronarchaeum sp. AMET-Sl]
MSDLLALSQEIGELDGLKVCVDVFFEKPPHLPKCQEYDEEIDPTNKHIVLKKGEKVMEAYHFECFPEPTEELERHLSPAFKIAELSNTLKEKYCP